MAKINYFAFADRIRANCPDLEFISGKWFYKKETVKDIDRFLLKLAPSLCSVDELQKLQDAFIMLHGDPHGDWYPLPIIEEARNQKELKPLCYPLNQKQLIIINYLLRHDEEVFFILTGVGGSGKSTFANIICQIFDRDMASLNLSDLSDDFKLATGVGKRLIYSDELNSDDINSGQLKQLFSGQMLTVNPKHERPYQTRFQSAFFFNCNIVPRLDICDSGMMRRILYYGMNERIKNPDPTMNTRSWTHDDLVNIVAHALSQDMTDWRKHFEKETRQYLVENNSVYICKTEYRYCDYVKVCKEKGLKPFSEPKWQNIRKLLSEWGLLTVTFDDSEGGAYDELPF